MKIVRFFLKSFLVIFMMWLGFFIFLVHPDPSRVVDPLDRLSNVKESVGLKLSIVHDLLFELDKAIIDSPNLAKGRKAISKLESVSTFHYAESAPADIAVSVTQGKHAMFLEQRNAIYMPSGSKVTFTVKKVPDSGNLDFGLSIVSRLDGKESAPTNFIVNIKEVGSNETASIVLDKTLLPVKEFKWSETDFWYHDVLKFIRIDGDFFNGRWFDEEVDLTPWAGKDVTVTFTSKSSDGSLTHGFIGTPRIYAPVEDEKPNVIVFVLDTLRADYVGVGVTPNIDKVAAKGIPFTNVRAQANWSRGSYQSMFMGVPTTRLGFGHRWSFSHQERDIFYKRKLPSLPDEMRKAGFTTVTVGNNPFTYDGSLVGVNLGFDQAIDIQREPYDTEFSTDQAVRWLIKNRDKRFFMMFTLNSPHSPFRPPFKYFPEAMTATLNLQKFLYRGAVAYGDDYFGNFLEALKRLKLKDDTLIVITGDHGVIIDRFGKIRSSKDGEYEEINATHTHTLYEEEVHVPLIFAGAGVRGEGASNDTSLALLDLAPTVATLSGVTPPDLWTGISVDDLINGEGDHDREERRANRIVPATGDGVYMTFRSDGVKYLRRDHSMARIYDDSPRSISEELYSLNSDPYESNDLSQSNPNLVEKMRDRYRHEYPHERKIGKIIVRGVKSSSANFEVTTDGEFLFLDVEPEKGNSDLTKIIDESTPGKRVVVLNNIESLVRVYFETMPDDASVTLKVIGDNTPLFKGPFALDGAGDSVTFRASESWELLDNYRLVDEKTVVDGVYLTTAPFSSWRYGVANGVRLDPELEKLMIGWGYM